MRLSLTGKLGLAFGFVAILTSVAGIYLAFTLGTVGSNYGKVLDLTTADTASSDAAFYSQAQLAAIRGVILYKRPELINDFNKYSALNIETIDLMERQLSAASVLTAKDQADLAELERLNAKYATIAKETHALVVAGKFDEAVVHLGKEGPATATAMTSLAGEIASRLATITGEQKVTIQDQVARTQRIGYLAVAVGLAVGLGVGLFLARSISHPVRQVAANAKRLGSGDLGVEPLQITSRDEVGEMAQAFNVMVQNLRELLQGVSTNARSVMSASQELATSAEQAAQSAQGAAQAVSLMAAGAGEQSQNADEVSKTMGELRQTIQQVAHGASNSAAEVGRASGLLNQMVVGLETVARNAAGVSAGTNEAARTAKVGSEVVDQTLTGMERIKQAVGASSDRIRELEKLSGQIGEITTAIAEIADQTNLLALNAAIEAARAGEHGRGFAVVAEEVRKLAERAATSTRQISGLIGAIQTETAEAVRAMDQGTAQVEAGSQLATKAGHSLAEILRSVQSAAAEVTDIANAAAQVQRDASHVVQAFDSMAAVTEQSTAAAEQMAASSAQVSDSVTRIADVSQSTAASAQEVSASVEELTASSEEVSASAQGLGRIAQALEAQVARFRL